MPARDAGERVTAPLRGSCLCGSVRFEIDGPFEGAAHCHCASCKKLSGGVGTTSGRIATDAIHIVAGEDLLQRFQPEEGSAKTFCSACGSNLFGAGWPESEVSVVRLAAVDAGLDQAPQAHIFVRSVAPWQTLPEDGLPRFEARP